jgi:hypothetical protein
MKSYSALEKERQGFFPDIPSSFVPEFPFLLLPPSEDDPEDLNHL